ncbi:Transcriptional regulator, LuxR family [Burkholderiales bacterium 8X]|nr:Transcriptional regulator, LuxR family [Burkholderiales bacterium 8X]
MQTWIVEASSSHRLVDATSVAALVDAIGSQDPERLATCILDAVEPMVGARQCTVFAHEAQRNPRLLSAAATDGPWTAFRTGAVHAREFESQDALRQILDRKPAVGPVGVMLVARQRADEMPIASLRLECMDAIDLVDRLTLLVRTGESSWVAAHLYADRRHGSFDDEEIDGLIGVATLLARCIGRHYASDADGVASFRGSVSQGVAELGERLTVREREVLTRILDGVTVNRIAEDLKLRPTTVATYRMRAYEKLGVASRQELFATVLRRRAANSPAVAAAANASPLLGVQGRPAQNNATLLHIA